MTYKILVRKDNPEKFWAFRNSYTLEERTIPQLFDVNENFEKFEDYTTREVELTIKSE